MDELVSTIQHGDCIAGMNNLEPGSIDLAFADPPFNIGYDYDVYDDRQAYDKYLAWSRDWIAAVHRVLKPHGTFWLAIGDEFAAELKLASQAIGFHTRSWVVWYYTFGVNCTKKFTRSHAHLFYFVKNPRKFTFRDDDPANRIPSARQLVYNDNRANPRGRLPDDTWIIRPADAIGQLMPDDDATWTLRPQDLDDCFGSDENTWYFPRIAGTFKERARFHGCQMPEQLLGRIIRTCSNERDIVLDPFSGSATTLAVAKKLGRRYLGFEISADYARRGQERLESIRVGDRLVGSPTPLLSAPKTGHGKRGSASRENALQSGASRKRRRTVNTSRLANSDRTIDQEQLADTCRGVIEAFRFVRHGFSADRIVADPELNREYLEFCRKLGLYGDARTWNLLLFRLRKHGKLARFVTSDRTTMSWHECDSFIFGSEIAWQTIVDDGEAATLDEILCDPSLAEEFDKRAQRWAPGFSPLQYRWAALKLRKQAKLARSRGSVLVPPRRAGRKVLLEDADAIDIAETAGIYLLTEPESTAAIYVGEAMNLRSRLASRTAWTAVVGSVEIQTFRIDPAPVGILAWQSCMAKKHKPRLNVRRLYAER